jgi:hypothetical protein
MLRPSCRGKDDHTPDLEIPTMKSTFPIRTSVCRLSPPDLYNLLERSNSSPTAVLVHILATVLISFPPLVTILESVPVFHSLPGAH